MNQGNWAVGMETILLLDSTWISNEIVLVFA